MGLYSNFIEKEYQRLFLTPRCIIHGVIKTPYVLQWVNLGNVRVQIVKCGKCDQ